MPDAAIPIGSAVKIRRRSIVGVAIGASGPSIGIGVAAKCIVVGDGAVSIAPIVRYDISPAAPVIAADSSGFCSRKAERENADRKK